jgi:hypothetical protein
MICELFYKLKDHPSAVAQWLAAIVNENNGNKVNEAVVTGKADEKVNNQSLMVYDTTEKRATLEEPSDSSCLL